MTSACRAAGSAKDCALIARLVGLAAATFHRLQELGKGSTNFFTPSARSSSVTAVQEITGFFEGVESPRAPRYALLQARPRPAVVAEGGEGLRRDGVDGLGARSAPPRRGRRGSAGSWCRCWPTARAGSGRPWPSRPPSADRRISSCSARTRAWRWRWPPLPRRPAERAFSGPSAVLHPRLSSASTALSMRLTKKLATLATPETSPPSASARLEAVDVGLATVS